MELETRKIMNRIFVFLLLISTVVVAQKKWVASNASVAFKIKNAGLTVDGKFVGLEAEIVFDAENPENATIQASVLTKTIDTGIGARDNHLKKDEYFWVDKFPKISLKSIKIVKKDVGFSGTFLLTMKGMSKEIILPFTFEGQILKGNFSLNRLGYGIGKSNWLMSDEVTVFIEIKVQ
jgi:polyisoprenoid-binding protein YceI